MHHVLTTQYLTNHQDIPTTCVMFHPSEIQLEEFMQLMDISRNQHARDIARISDIVDGKRVITADTALRPGKYFGVSPEPGRGSKPTTTCALRHAPSAPKWEKSVQRHTA